MFVEHLDRLRAHLRPESDLRYAFARAWAGLTEARRGELARDAERYIRQPIPMWTASSEALRRAILRGSRRVWGTFLRP